MANLDISLLPWQQCKTCKQEKNSNSFSLTPSGKLRGTCKECRSAQNKGEKARNRKLKHKYGISHADYLTLLEKQEGKCAICYTKAEDQYHGVLDVDHNHETGEVRGLLCNSCNRFIGLAQDNPTLLKNAMNYLNKKGYYG